MVMMMIMMMFAQFCDRNGCQPWLPWISIRAAHSTQVHSTMMSQCHSDDNRDRMMSVIITTIKTLIQKAPSAYFTNDHRPWWHQVIIHLSLPLVMSCQGIMMVCLRVLRLSAFVETQTHQFYFWSSARVASSMHWNDMESWLWKNADIFGGNRLFWHIHLSAFSATHTYCSLYGLICPNKYDEMSSVNYSHIAQF